MILNVALFVKSVSWRSMTLVLLLGALVGCQSLKDSDDWSSDLTERDYFLDAYQADTENQQEQTQQQYLSWIIRFYQGSDLMSTGWNELTPAVLMGMSGDTLINAEEESRELGLAISAEWAKDNSVRKINTAMLSLWGTVMLSVEEPPARLVALRQIASDVGAVMRGELSAEEISDERYMTLLDLPDFF